MTEIILTPEQEAEAAQIQDILMGAARAEFGRIARLLASKPNKELFGQTEFQVRDIVHDLAARAFDAALAERKKGGTKGPASSVPSAERTPVSSVIGTAK
jgi:hypothetical protein